MTRRSAAVAVVLSILAAACTSRPLTRDREPVGDQARAGIEEAQEQAEATERRLEAYEQAVADGRFGTFERIRSLGSPGFSGERLLTHRANDWEPALATDPNAPFAYALATRYTESPTCRLCPVPFIALAVSKNGGRTWSATRPLCPCEGTGQFDPIVEVVPDNGDVYALFMKGFHVVFTRSRGHGRTWSRPVRTYGEVVWNDKPVIAMSDDGRDVYVSWNGPTDGDPWVAQSHDRGRTWIQKKLVASDRYFFAFDADVLPDGRVVFAQSSIDYSGAGGAPVGEVWHHAIVSSDRGASWSDVVVDRVQVGEPCVSAGCGPDFYIGHDAVSADVDGDLVFLYDGAAAPLGPQRIFARRSTDGGLTWSGRVPLSAFGENATAPAVEQIGDGDVRAFYYQTNGGDPHGWNVWFRRSRDGGATWNAKILLSDAASGARYKDSGGFLEVYGDYGEIAVNSQGRTLAIWGEGFSWDGPGGVWHSLGR